MAKARVNMTVANNFRSLWPGTQTAPGWIEISPLPRRVWLLPDEVANSTQLLSVGAVTFASDFEGD
jgi:hypothetical protein